MGRNNAGERGALGEERSPSKNSIARSGSNVGRSTTMLHVSARH